MTAYPFLNEVKNFEITPVYQKKKVFSINFQICHYLGKCTKDILQRCVSSNEYILNLVCVNVRAEVFKEDSEHLQLILLEKFRKTLDKGLCGIMITVLSISFDCIDQLLVIAKSHAYSFEDK